MGDCFGKDRAWIELDMGALRHNVAALRALLPPGCALMPAVKADAYGHGAVLIARELNRLGVRAFCVASAREGAQLRGSGVEGEILVLGYTHPRLIPLLYRSRLTQTVLDASYAECLNQAGLPLEVQIKIDTGMHRLGFAPEDMPRLIERLKGQNAVIARSVFSHLVGSDSQQFDSFTRRQIEMFEKASMELQEAFPHKILRHICNSAGIERFPGAQFDMVRLGIGLYGVNPIDNSIMNNVSTLKTTILQIRDVPEEDTVGYSRKGHLTRPSRIAALPIGYADGLNRHLGNGHAYCLVNGQRAAYVGNICMDVCMIDVTDIDCKEGDSVEIFGDHLPITVLSDVLETIPYEVLTSVSTRVKRIYYQD